MLIVYLALTIAVFAVYWQVSRYDFVNYDDNLYVTENRHVQSGITFDTINWAFSTKETGLWNPLVWLSLMLDFHLFGLNAGGYHLTNVIVHILSALLLFGLLNRMTGAVWKSAFVAAFFALHPLHVESVAWIAERKDVLSAFFWMLTLYFYFRYAEEPTTKKYILIFIPFVLALMSKPITVTLPVIMILLDYWPLQRFASHKGHLIFRQLKEKAPFFALSAICVFIVLMHKDTISTESFPLNFRLGNIPIVLVTYLEKTFYPHDMAIFYPYPEQINLWCLSRAVLFIAVVSAAVVITAKRCPFLLTGWLWYLITVLPVVGLLQIGAHLIADRYHYLPSVGIAIMAAWGIPSLIKKEQTKKLILIPAGLASLAIMAFLSWQQCGYWENSISLWSHALKVTENNPRAHDGRGTAYDKAGQNQLAVDDYNEAIRLKPNYVDVYIKRGGVYNKLGQYEKAIADFSAAILLRPDFADSYNNRGVAYALSGQYQRAVDDYGRTIRLKPDFSSSYYNRGLAYIELGRYRQAIDDFNRVIRLIPDHARAYNNRGLAYDKLDQHRLAIADFNKAISIIPYYSRAYVNRGNSYLSAGDRASGCPDLRKACEFGQCEFWEDAKRKENCT